MSPRGGCKRKLAMSSLPCVKKHKAELTCNGVRDKTAYISLQQFTEMNLLSDYRFLEDVARTADQVSRDTFLKRPKRKKYLLFMKNRARKQGIFLKLLPNGFSKRKENSTVFDHRKQQFCWHVKLQFPQSQAEYTEKRYYELDPNKSLLDNLRSKVIIEYPTLHVVLKGSSSGMQLLHQGNHVCLFPS
ncbi:Box C/D snoRNA protein 1 [Cricetulus griseus]|uniref:Box C/D snoRNA protein 1 n=1 Tax=Cricetulus griseus TaxID=10029 RepID=G3IDP6_CRIGR|nr:Box C/D snoRNA protein 1 [Cricetulus griseus]